MPTHLLLKANPRAILRPDLAGRRAEAEVGRDTGVSPAEKSIFRHALRQKRIEGLEVLRVVAEAALRRPSGSAGNEAGRAPLLPSVEHRIVTGVDHRLIAKGPAARVSEGQIAIVIDPEIALHHRVVIAGPRRPRRLIETDVGGGRVRLGGQRRRAERRLVLRLPSQ